MNGRSRTLIIFYLMAFYLLASVVWWAKVMYGANNSQAEIKTELLKLGVLESESLSDIESQRKRQNRMLLLEGLVFLGIVFVGFARVRSYFKEEIRLANQQKDFLLSITHELKSPIASAKLGAETLLKRELPPAKRASLGVGIVEDMDRLETLVENLLFAAKLDSPNHKFSKKEVDFSVLVQEAVDRAEMGRGENNRVKTHVEGSLFVLGDRLALFSLVHNLVENALKYSSENDSVSVVLKPDGPSVILSVADEGFGIPKEERQNVFKKFYRLGSEETRKTKGTGLGLYIVKEVVEAHGGRVRVEQAGGGGALLLVEIPRIEH